jgi:hypothetical protein
MSKKKVDTIKNNQLDSLLDSDVDVNDEIIIKTNKSEDIIKPTINTKKTEVIIVKQRTIEDLTSDELKNYKRTGILPK